MYRVNYFARALWAVLLMLLAVSFASFASAAVPVPVSITYTLPTQACVYVNGVKTTTCGPLTGADALTGIEVYLSTTPIADDASLTPTATLAPTAQTYQSTFQASNGDKIYVRLKAKTLVQSLFSNQVFKDVVVTTVPDAPVVITIGINVAP